MIFGDGASGSSFAPRCCYGGYWGIAGHLYSATPAAEAGSTVVRRTMSEPLIPDNILRFLNALPTTGDTVEWILQFRAALQELLGDVDRIAVNININCDLAHPEKYNPGIDIRIEGFPPLRKSLEIGSTLLDHVTPAERALADYKRLGYPLEEYQAPIGYDYFVAGHAHVATLFLFRRRGLPQISKKTVRAMKSLEPFLLFAFSGLVAHHYRARPVDVLFIQLLDRVRKAAKLSKREGQVIMLHLFGLSYAEIARQLFISENTVAKHVKSAHRKTGCQSFLELFRPYFREALPEAEI